MRSAPWPRVGTVAELDAVTGGRPAVVIAGDAHNGWLNSAALAHFGLEPRTDPLAENEWFAIFGALATLPGVDDLLDRDVPEPARSRPVTHPRSPAGFPGLRDRPLAPCARRPSAAEFVRQ